MVKAFNGIYAAQLLDGGRPPGAEDRRALPIAGDDASAEDVVLALLDELGFDGVDAGGLDESWRQQPGTPVYGASAGAVEITQLLAQASPERTAEWRASSVHPALVSPLAARAGTARPRPRRRS